MIGFDDDGNVMGGSFGGNLADAAVGTAGAMEGATASEGLGNVTSANPTFSFNADQPISPQIAKQKSFLDQLKGVLNFSPTLSITKSLMSMVPENMRAPTYGVMSLPGYQGLTNNLGYDPNLAQAYGTTTGVPYGFDEAMQNVPVVGSGPHLGLATSIANIGGKAVHMGPGFMMDENNYPGYGFNPVTGEGFSEGGWDYIRPRRGTEITELIQN